MRYIIEISNIRGWERFCITEEAFLAEHLNSAKEMCHKVRYREFPNGTNRWRYVKGDFCVK